MQLDFADVLLEVVDRRASDLHITAGAPPMVRVRGRLRADRGLPALTPTDTREIVYSILSERPAPEAREQLAARLRLPDPRARRASASTPTSSARRSAPPSA